MGGKSRYAGAVLALLAALPLIRAVAQMMGELLT